MCFPTATYFVMEYLGGGAFTKLMEEARPLPVPRIITIAKQIRDRPRRRARRGHLHRDLKPDNVMLIPRGKEKDFVKILDFGIAKVQTGNTSRLTQAGAVFGTPHYMSPEQAAGAPVKHTTDIYSLGVMLYEMAAGKVPFDAENFMGILTMHMYKAPVPMRALVPAPQEYRRASTRWCSSACRRRRSSATSRWTRSSRTSRGSRPASSPKPSTR